MDLAESFNGFNDNLRGLLRDTAARADRDAMAMGELDAMKTQASANMAAIDVKLKEAVDSHKLDPIRRVAYQQAFSARVGADLAQTGLQSDLDAQLDNAIKGDPQAAEQTVQASLKKWSGQLRKDDIHMGSAFAQTASGVVAGFRQRVAEGRAAEYRQNSQQAMADEGSEIAFRIATAHPDDLPGLHAQLKTHLDALRQELPKSDVNPFFVTKVAAPAVEKLVAQQKFHEADQLLDEMERTDVTGTGGLLGGTAVAKAVFSDLRAKIDRGIREGQSEEYVNFNHAREMAITKGVDAAGSALNQIKLGTDGRLDPDARFKLIEDFRKKNPTEPLMVQGFEEAVNNAYDKQDKWRSNDRLISDLSLAVNTVDKDKLDAVEAQIEVGYHAGEVPPQVRTQLRQTVDKLRSLYGAIDEGDFKQMKRDLYAFSKDAATGKYVVNFGDNQSAAKDASQILWDNLPQALQDEHEQKTTQFFSSVLQDELRKIGDPNKVPAEKAKAIDTATVKTREFARTLLLSQVKQQKQTAAAAEVAAHAKRLRDASLAGPFTVSPNFDYYPADAKPGDKQATFDPSMKNRPFIMKAPPRAGSQPMPEADVVDVYFPAHSFGEWLKPGPAGSSRVVSLPELVTTMREGDPAVALKARDTYAYVKGRLGFTPEEIQKSTTKHGVPFTPSEIDPNRITVFRSRAELEKHWNNGKPDDVFNEVGHAVDPKDTMTARDLYLAQLALFTGRTK
jgi:hypothetical protein